MGFSNLGDDAIRDAWDISLAGVKKVHLPTTRRQRIVGMGSFAALAIRNRHLVLGGGTMIGSPIWRKHLALGLKICRKWPAVMLGVGADDPRFSEHGFNAQEARTELHKWRELIEKYFESVTVRGPRTQQVLSEVGIASRVVGDPALLLEPSRTMRPPEYVGFNVGSFGPSQIAAGLIHRSFIDHVIPFASSVAPIRLFVMSPADLPAASCIMGEVRARHDLWVELVFPRSASEFLEEVASCKAIVAERLHATVLAAAAGVPALALRYRGKVQDFQDSIGRGRYTTDCNDAEEMVSLLSELLAEPELHRKDVQTSVALRRECLHAESMRIRSLLEGR